jgi:hypothetical protein
VASRRLSSEGPAKCKKKSLVCSQCGDSFREGEFGAHARQNHAYPCAFCSLSFTYVNGRDNHQNAAHTPESVASQAKVFCSICGLGFPRTATLNKHAKREHDVLCRDRTCRRRFTNTAVMEAHAAENHGLFRTGGAAASAKAASASVGKSSPPVRVRNQHYGAAIVDSSAGRKSSGNSVVKSDRSDSSVLKKTKARLCAAFNIDEKNMKKKPAGTAEGPKKRKGRPKKSQTVSAAAPSSSPAPVVAEKDDTMCEQCGKQIPDFEEFFEHINTDHTESCSICFMAFVHDFYLREHKYLRHGCARPPITDRPPSPPPRSRPDRKNSASPAAGDGNSDSEADMDDDLLLPDISPLNPEPPRQSSAYRIPKLNKDPSVPGVLPLEFPCDDCCESFSTAAALVKHLQERHYDPTRPGSSSSDRSSTAGTHLRPQALPTSGGKGNTCAECGQSFSTGDALKAHADSTHFRKEAQSSGARRPEQACHLCGEKFPRDRIGQHLLKSHPDGRAPVGGLPPAASAPTAAGRELTCDLCGREFRHVYNVDEN